MPRDNIEIKVVLIDEGEAGKHALLQKLAAKLLPGMTIQVIDPDQISGDPNDPNGTPLVANRDSIEEFNQLDQFERVPSIDFAKAMQRIEKAEKDWNKAFRLLPHNMRRRILCFDYRKKGYPLGKSIKGLKKYFKRTDNSYRPRRIYPRDFK